MKKGDWTRAPRHVQSISASHLPTVSGLIKGASELYKFDVDPCPDAASGVPDMVNSWC